MKADHGSGREPNNISPKLADSHKRKLFSLAFDTTKLTLAFVFSSGMLPFITTVLKRCCFEELLVLLRGDSRMGDESQIAGSARRSPPDSFHQLRGFLSACVIKAFLRSAFGDTFTDGSSPETAIKEHLIDINSSTTKQLVQFFAEQAQELRLITRDCKIDAASKISII